MTDIRELELENASEVTERLVFQGDLLIEWQTLSIVDGDDGPVEVFRRSEVYSHVTGLREADEFSAPDGVRTEIVEDEDGVDRFETRFDGEDRPVYEEVIDLDGISRQSLTDYDRDGAVYHTWTVEADTGDLREWALRETVFQAGIGSFTRTIHDTGLTMHELWDSDGVLEARAFQDFGDEFNWIRSVDVYDSVGALRLREVTRDDGREVMDDYDDGRLVSRTIEDHLDAYSYDVMEIRYDAGGNVEERRTFRDNGIETWSTYEDGQLLRSIITDTDNVRDWWQVEVVYGADGSEIERIETPDDIREFNIELDGRGYSLVFQGDLLIERETRTDNEFVISGPVILTEYTWAGLTDVSYLVLLGDPTEVVRDVDGFDRIETRFDSDGEIRYEEFVDLDGVSRQTWYESDLTTTIEADTGDIEDWALRESVAGGDLVSILTVFDNGQHLSEILNTLTGLVESRETVDLPDEFQWMSRIEAFDDAGALVERIDEWDDGRKVTDDYEDGALVFRRIEDRADAYNYDVMEIRYDANGDVEERRIVRDNGIDIVRTFEEGRMVQSVATDRENVRDWWQQEEQLVIRESGVEALRVYEDGERVRTILTDVEDVRDWWQVEITHGRGGVELERIVTLDEDLLL